MSIILTNSHEVRVRYADTDKMGYLYNGNYLAFFEVGRTELMRNYGMCYKEIEENGYLLPLIDAYVKYIKPAYYDDLLTISAKLNYDSGPILKFEYNILKNDSIITSGFTTHIFVKSDTQVPVKPPKIFIDVMKSLKDKN
ncbi:MAG TPA: thioesterase family protein [Candidatus Kapabacteria bacterium]|nr:thioesterase family protein [Candidatus Kapabacteria bacterium]